MRTTDNDDAFSEGVSSSSSGSTSNGDNGRKTKAGRRYGLRLLSRSPHPYHRRNTNLQHAADRLASSSDVPTSSTTTITDRRSQVSTSHNALHNTSSTSILTPTSAMSLSPAASEAFGRDSVPGSDSGTEADDEHFLKGLPAPRSKLHKGLRGMNEVLSGVSTPLRPAFSHQRSDGDGGGGDDGTRSRARREGNAGSDGGESLAGSAFSLLEDEASHSNAIGQQQGQGHERSLRKRHSTGSTTTISLQTLFRRLKGELAGDVAASPDGRVKMRGQSRTSSERSRQRRDIAHRSTEILLLVVMAVLVFSKPSVQTLVAIWSNELWVMGIFVTAIILCYLYWLVSRVPDGVDVDPSFGAEVKRSSTKLSDLRILASYDPAPLLYPLALPIFVSFLLATPTLPAAPMINIVLSLCTLPRDLFRPFWPSSDIYIPAHWLVTLVPMLVVAQNPSIYQVTALDCVFPRGPSSAPPPYVLLESSALLYPLHVSLCGVLRDLTSTSLLPAELQLLSVALINLLVLAMSPQTVILQALLWIGGVGLVVLGGHAVRWGITLARIPRWRFRRAELGAANKAATDKSLLLYLSPVYLSKLVWAELKSLRRARLEVMYGLGGDHGRSDDSAGDSDLHPHLFAPGGSARRQRARAHSAAAALATAPTATGDNSRIDNFDPGAAPKPGTSPSKRPSRGQRVTTHTPSGRKKRTASPTVRALFSLTHEQAVRRKWLYAGYLYACIALLILVGIRPHVGAHALQGREPFGWALGYLFGDVGWFRLEIVKAGLESWVCLPSRSTAEKCQSWRLLSPRDPVDSYEDALACPSCHAGWVEYNRQLWFGAATTRLLLVGYWVVVLVFGLAVVFALSPVYEVDTRRKVFHFMMVAMLLPATFVDPTYVALALSLVLAVFLLLDMLRASQLPPLSRPIATFLTPYVDGRDLRGPVVISHIFLLIGCAIPLWLSLAALPRLPLSTFRHPAPDFDKCVKGWEVPSRDISMVAGVICVGLGDAAASLIGRRWGRHKWLWGGGKSLEGSVAFAVAVFLGLMLAHAWLRIGGWPVRGREQRQALAEIGAELTRPRSFAFLRPLAPPLASFVAKLPPVLQRGAAWLGTTVAPSVAPRAALCASLASLTEAVLTGGNDNVVVPVILWTCVKSFEL